MTQGGFEQERSVEGNVSVEQLAADRFFDTLEAAADLYLDDETAVLEIIQDCAAEEPPLDFAEPKTPEDELTHHAVMVETQVSSFIESRVPMQSLALLNEDEIRCIEEIYNPHNLLFLAQDFIKTYDALTPVQGDILLRYRSVIMQLRDLRVAINRASYHDQQDSVSIKRVGKMTWGGYMHPYSFETRWLYPDEYQEFSSREDDGLTKVTINGVEVDVKVRNTRVI